MNFEEYSEHVHDKLKKGSATVDRWVKKMEAGTGPIKFCSQCGDKMIIRSSRAIDENHKEYFYVCSKCGRKETDLVRRIDIKHIFLETTSLSDIEKYISPRELHDNLTLIVKMYDDINERLESDRKILQEQIDAIDDKYKVFIEKFELIDRKICSGQ